MVTGAPIRPAALALRLEKRWRATLASRRRVSQPDVVAGMEIEAGRFRKGQVCAVAMMLAELAERLEQCQELVPDAEYTMDFMSL